MDAANCQIHQKIMRELIFILIKNLGQFPILESSYKKTPENLKKKRKPSLLS